MGSAQVPVVAVGGKAATYTEREPGTPSSTQRRSGGKRLGRGQGAPARRSRELGAPRKTRRVHLLEGPPSCSVSASVVGPARKPANIGRRARSASFRVRLRASGRGQARRKGIAPIPFTVTFGQVSHAWESAEKLLWQIMCSVAGAGSGGLQLAGLLARLTKSSADVRQGGALR